MTQQILPVGSENEWTQILIYFLTSQHFPGQESQVGIPWEQSSYYNGSEVREPASRLEEDGVHHSSSRKGLTALYTSCPQLSNTGPGGGFWPFR